MGTTLLFDNISISIATLEQYFSTWERGNAWRTTLQVERAQMLTLVELFVQQPV